MKIKRVEIENYRNLGGMRILLNDDISFIVGENNIGKSNFQKCLSNIFSCKPFAKEDFYDEAYEALKECSDWWMEKGTGQIWEVSFGLHAQRKKVYDSYTQGPAK